MSRVLWHILLMSVIPIGCGLTPEPVSRDDEQLIPMWEAIARVDRESLGFTPISADARIRLEGPQLWGDDYDAMLHIDGDTSRTIAFRKVGAGYEWIGEQEIHHGQNTFTTVDGTFREQIVIDYNTQYVSGVPLNTVHVSYRGDDPRLRHSLNLTLDDVRPILLEWKEKPRILTPP